MSPLRLLPLIAMSACLTLNCSSKTKTQTESGGLVQAPKPERKLEKLVKHGDAREDYYFWMKERTSEKVLNHLKDENSYVNATLKPVTKLREELYEELKKRIKQEDSTYPAKEGQFEYYERFEKGKEHPIFCRKPVGSSDSDEIILVDGNDLAQGKSYFAFGASIVSPDGNLLAYSADYQGRRLYTIYIKDLLSGKTLKTSVPNTTGEIAWAKDNATLFYIQQNPETLRAERLLRFNLQSGQSTEIYFEKDETFSLHLESARTQNYVFLFSESTLSSEVRYLDASKPTDDFKVFQKREKNHEYSVEDAGDHFLIVTNDKAKNFRLMETSYNKTRKTNWKTVIKHNPKILIEGVEAFKTHYVVKERENGLRQLRIYDRKTKKSTRLEFKDPAYMVSVRNNLEFDQSHVRYGYESPTTPDSYFDYDFKTSKHTLRKQQEVLGGFDAKNYEAQRFSLPSHDGVMVPVTLVFKKGIKFTVTTPLLVYGYGSYGISIDPTFNESRISLLDRGFVIATAHIRGGSDLGRKWYEDGRQMKKKNTFLDFIAVTEGLHKKGLSSPAHSFALGGSAGGLLMGAIVNMRPDLYRAIVAQVPFVDVVTTMLDPSIPLTTAEYEQWGNPNDKKPYMYIKSYSPYDNVSAKSYPSILAVTGFHDSQVQYWEPAKWIALLREKSTSGRPVLLKTDMDSGHGGQAGRFEALKDIAMIYAYLIGVDNNQI